jgi:hypothetical protein
MGQKQFLLRAFIATFAIINVLVFVSIYQGLKNKHSYDTAYEENLKLYI